MDGSMEWIVTGLKRDGNSQPAETSLDYLLVVALLEKICLTSSWQDGACDKMAPFND